MSARCLCALAILAFPTTWAFGQEADVKAEMAEFQGTWSVVSLFIDGKTLDPESQHMMCIFDGDQVVLKVGDRILSRGTFSINTAADPKHFDVTNTLGPRAGKVDAGVYVMSWDTLKIAACAGDDSLTKRPAHFPAEGEKGFEIMVLKPLKP
jgi:uncharacterized protein (TIGR03067 family)